MTNPFIRPARDADIVAIQKIAATTWPVAYAEILSGKQVAYMMDMMYSYNVLESQLQNPGHFFNILITENNTEAGFYHLNQSEENNLEFKLNKIYLTPLMHGKSLGKMLLEHAENLARQNGGELIQLQVNKYNKARFFYERNGYTVAYQKDFDIGAGFFMNDYVMEKKLV